MGNVCNAGRRPLHDLHNLSTLLAGMRSIAAASLLVLAFTSADLPSLQASTAYDQGEYGHRPLQFYVSTEISSPRFNLVAGRGEYNDGLCTFLAPHGYKISKPGPLIIKDDTLVWTTPKYGKAFDFKVQSYKDRPFLTFWTGYDHVGRGHGIGQYSMLDTSYNLFKQFGAGNGMDGDLHEFSITPDDKALITVYDRREVDLSLVSTHRSSGFIWDSLFQEVDIESGNVDFQWRASDHIPLTSSYRPIAKQGSFRDAWDWFHINSVQKDDTGNYLVSSRYLEGLVYISGSTGEVLWYLGGKQSSFVDLSDGSATDFAFQHDARWVGNTTITLFDNAIDYEYPDRAPYSRGLHLALDLEKMTVRRIAEYNSPEYHAAPSQGSLQILENGNILMGYGDLAAFTEFAPDGSVIRETHFAPQSEFGTDYVQSYRVFKYPWKGFPSTLPDVAVRGNNIYVSWNGATEVQEWVLELVDNITIAKVPKTGFETSISFDDEALDSHYIRVSALDRDGHVLGHSRAVDWASERILIFRLMHAGVIQRGVLAVAGGVVLGVCLYQGARAIGRTLHLHWGRWKYRRLRYARL